MRISDWSSDVCSSDLETNPGIAVGPGDPAAVLMTSGTTGPSKGVVMLHSQFYFFAEEDVQLTRLTADDVYMTGLPLFHGNAKFRSEERRVGKVCVRTGRFWWSPYH